VNTTTVQCKEGLLLCSVWLAWDFAQINVYFLHTCSGADAVRGRGVMTACQRPSWWRWWSDTLWATFIRLLLTTVIVRLTSKCCFGVFSEISYISSQAHCSSLLSLHK
jgi:hypothetical protein